MALGLCIIGYTENTLKILKLNKILLTKGRYQIFSEESLL